ncbi:hypothetical protein HS088_TW21G00570 [Tripterygium wilfordii]|uniref:Uncharacterized protein n=1 Tax=Tripterygium wilfordii TaxID=458696 RepID=A0A7J7C2T6_TRIWF|nr:uncharacterized protein LOC119990070 [Tripterygium wilfordii]KAF5728423.1 hypothetical protein HS088_TW21G00570 [Tripterygium wilfordii]
MSGHLFLCKSPRSPSLLKPLTSYLHNPIKQCSDQASNKEGDKAKEFIEERAPSTAQVFKKFEEEKLKATKQGGGDSETIEQAREEVTHGDSKVGSAKERSKKAHEEDHI